MVRIARTIAAPLLAAVAVAVGATPALAECPPRDDDRFLNVGYAFTATVTEASADVGPAVPGNADFDWHLRLRVDRVYVGAVPDSIAFDGWEAGCYGIRGDRMHAGDRVFIAAEVFDADALPRKPLGGDFLMWKWDDGRWAFYRDAIGWNVEDQWLTSAMRNASTTAAILAIVRSAPPDTSTADDHREDDGPRLALLLLAFASSFVFVVPRTRLRDR